MSDDQKDYALELIPENACIKTSIHYTEPVVWETKSPEAIRIGRLERKIIKLKMQRDHFKEQYELLRTVLNDFPFIEARVDDHTKAMEKRKREKEILATQDLLVAENARLKEQLKGAKIYNLNLDLEIHRLEDRLKIYELNDEEYTDD